VLLLLLNLGWVFWLHFPAMLVVVGQQDVQQCLAACGASVVDMSAGKDATHIIAKKWHDGLSEALLACPNAVVVHPRWLKSCVRAQVELPTAGFEMADEAIGLG
jgi:hypothetical protein